MFYLLFASSHSPRWFSLKQLLALKKNYSQLKFNSLGREMRKKSFSSFGGIEIVTLNSPWRGRRAQKRGGGQTIAIHPLNFSNGKFFYYRFFCRSIFIFYCADHHKKQFDFQSLPRSLSPFTFHCCFFFIIHRPQRHSVIFWLLLLFAQSLHSSGRIKKRAVREREEASSERGWKYVNTQKLKWN